MVKLSPQFFCFLGRHRKAMLCLSVLLFFSGSLFANNGLRDSTCIPVVTITVNENNICPGTTITFFATVANSGTGSVYTWKKNGLRAGVDDNRVYTSGGFHDGDVVVCEYSCKTSCGVDTTVVSNPITVKVNNDIVPVVTVANNDSLICEGELAVFTATASYGNAVPFYQWKVNGNPVGTNSPVFTTTTLTNGARVECELTISLPDCPGFSRSVSSSMTIYVYPMVHPAITITPSRTQICKGEEVTFTATANGGAFPSFVWMINGKQVGGNAPSLSTSILQDGDTISCTITIDIDSRCHTDTLSSTSNKVVIRVHDFVEPTISIAAPVLDVCAGSPVNFTATAQNAGTLTLYQWQVNGSNAGSDSPVFSYNQFANGDKVSCSFTTSINGCPFLKTILSNTELVKVEPAPSIVFSPPTITVMAGETAQLQAAVSGSPTSIQWSPAGVLVSPQSLKTATVPLAHDTVVRLSVVDTNGCVSAKDLLIKVLYRLYMPSAFTPNKDGKNDVFRIPPGASIELKEFLVFNRWGAVVFRTNDITKGWNGTVGGQAQDAGTYVYLIRGTVDGKDVTIKGTVTLVK